MDDTALILEKLGNIEYLLGVADVCLLFVIGSVTAVVVVLILYNFLKKCISKF